jgi:hypothetical protein
MSALGSVRVNVQVNLHLPPNTGQARSSTIQPSPGRSDSIPTPDGRPLHDSFQEPVAKTVAFKDLEPGEIHFWPPREMRTFSPKEPLSEWRPAEIKDREPEKFRDLAAKGVRDFSPAQIKDVSARELHRDWTPSEIRSFRPWELREVDPQTTHFFRPREMKDVGVKETRDFTPAPLATFKPHRTMDFDPLPFGEFHPREIRFPDPQEIKHLRPAELVDIAPPPTMEPHLPQAIEPWALEPPTPVVYQDLTSKELFVPEPFEPREVERVDLSALDDLTVIPGTKDLDLPGSEAYYHPLGRPQIDTELIKAQGPHDRYLHTTHKQPMSHWHYHYVPVPKDNIPPPRNRNVHFPDRRGLVDATA